MTVVVIMTQLDGGIEIARYFDRRCTHRGVVESQHEYALPELLDMYRSTPPDTLAINHVSPAPREPIVA